MTPTAESNPHRTSLDPSAQRPTRTRHWVIVFAATLAVITYMDRVCISQAAPAMREELGLDEVQMGWAFSAFLWAYALFEIPGGWMGDRWGARKVLMRVVVWWSAFTAATGWVWNLPSLLVTRAMFGAGEAGCFPNLTKAFMTWLPAHERVRAQGLMWLSARWGGAFTPPLVAAVFEWFTRLRGIELDAASMPGWLVSVIEPIQRHLTWRAAFELFGLVGVVWAIVFYFWYRDNPRDNRRVNKAELAILPRPEDVMLGHEPVPWAKFIQSKTVWLLWAQYTCLGYPWVFYITWLPTYLKESRGVAIDQVEMLAGLPPWLKTAALAGVPLFFGGLGSLFCGLVSGPLDRWTGNVRIARRCLASTGFALAAVCLVVSIRIEHPVWAMVAMGLASFSNDLAMPPSWGACMDVGGKYAGTLSGSMNMMSNLGQGVATVVTGYVLRWTDHSWGTVILIMAAVYLVGSVCWLFLDPATPLEQE
ncbi:MAG: MFS transporter [Pirellulales bacterium]